MMSKACVSTPRLCWPTPETKGRMSTDQISTTRSVEPIMCSEALRGQIHVRLLQKDDIGPKLSTDSTPSINISATNNMVVIASTFERCGPLVLDPCIGERHPPLQMQTMAWSCVSRSHLEGSIENLFQIPLLMHLASKRSCRQSNVKCR